MGMSSREIPDSKVATAWLNFSPVGPHSRRHENLANAIRKARHALIRGFHGAAQGFQFVALPLEIRMHNDSDWARHDRRLGRTR